MKVVGLLYGEGADSDSDSAVREVRGRRPERRIERRERVRRVRERVREKYVSRSVLLSVFWSGIWRGMWVDGGKGGVRHYRWVCARRGKALSPLVLGR